MAEQGLKNKKTSEVRENSKGSLYKALFFFFFSSFLFCCPSCSDLKYADLKGRRENGHLEKLWDERYRRGWGEGCLGFRQMMIPF